MIILIIPVVNGDLSGNGFWLRRPAAVQVLPVLVVPSANYNADRSINLLIKTQEQVKSQFGFVVQG